MYLLDGTVYHVQLNRQQTHCYAQQLQITRRGRAKWVHAPRAIDQLDDTQRLAVQEAARLGHLHGVCMVCGRQLAHPKSVEAGIGPVCIKHLS